MATTSAKVILHHLEMSRSTRILWVLEELGIPYEMVVYKRDPESKLAPPELAKIHPLGKAPVIVDEGVVVAESGVIIDYLIEKYGNGRLIPKAGTPEMLQYKYFLQFAEGSLMTPLFLRFIADVTPAKVPFIVRPVAKAIMKGLRDAVIDKNVLSLLRFCDGELAKSKWFAGNELTGADIQMSYPLLAARNRVGISEYPNLLRYLQQVEATPAYQRALEKGGPVELA